MKKRIRRVEPAPVFQPFYTRGNTRRNQYELKERGWYFVDDRGKLYGPYALRDACDIGIEDYTGVP